MRRGIVVAIVAMFVAAPGAFAASPAQIYKDLADNGRLDGTYTQAEMNAFLSDASVQGYGNPVVTTPPQKVKLTPPAQGVAGAQSPSQRPASTPVAQPAAATPQQPLQETAQAQTLPFTGAELGLFALVGGALLLGGFALRASSRRS